MGARHFYFEVTWLKWNWECGIKDDIGKDMFALK